MPTTIDRMRSMDEILSRRSVPCGSRSSGVLRARIPRVRILLASNNRKKLRELLDQLQRIVGPEVAVVTPREIGGIPDVVEDAPTFRGNAAKKAASAARHARMWALAD